ncbi:hypothetical protein [Paraburkholderia phytofirmans]|uniref:Uncharacterized protein n=1 Tax=Paraburkholderia phytofirmans TaxID=261302 RepID=A0ABW9BJD3_9BURK
MKYDNGAVLEALHLAQYRQIPWHKRPPVFTSLQALGLVRTVVQQPPVDTRHYTPVQIVELTDKGKEEAARLEARQQSPDWERERHADYAVDAMTSV